ncbi:helix-turn-helix transcriptional regulator [Rhodobacterales bacterium]|nr:helix-turn-helix transcriptional regulator [Rhodobacterales bacterium]
MTDHTPNMPNLNRLDLVGFALTYPADTEIAPHTHPAGQLIHAISGAMRVSANDMLWMLPVGRALWIPADVEHAIRCEGEVGMRTVYLSPACQGTPPSLQLIAVSALAREMLVRLAEGGANHLKPAFAAVLLSEIEAGSIAPFCLPIPAEPRIAELARALRKDPASRRSISAWAKRLGFSERNLIRTIRQETGMSFRELRRQTRVMIAIERLATGQSVTGVAWDVGFETPSAFIHAFRVVTGVTPRRFMANI